MGRHKQGETTPSSRHGARRGATGFALTSLRIPPSAFKIQRPEGKEGMTEENGDSRNGFTKACADWSEAIHACPFGGVIQFSRQLELGAPFGVVTRPRLMAIDWIATTGGRAR